MANTSLTKTNPQGSTTTLPIGTHAELYPNNPLPEFNTTGGAAFAARLKGDAQADLVAFVCSSGKPPRIDSINALRNLKHSSLLHFREHGVVYMPQQGMEYQVLAFDRPLSPRYRTSLDEGYPPIREDALNHHFIYPIIGALGEMEHAGMVHGAIRPTNIFWRDGSITPPQLGECLSVPSGVGQSIIFEPLDRAMTTEIGRGQGQHTDDCFAFGVMVAFLIIGENPFKGMTDEQIIEARLNQGTFSCMIGSRRLPSAHIELLRGLLADDGHQRWTATELEQWQQGRRFTPKSSNVGRRAARHFKFKDKDYWQVRPLAHAFSKHPAEAISIIQNGGLEKWLRRSLNDETLAESVSNAIKELKESGKTDHYEDQLVTHTCIALDPAAPIRYRGISVMPAGIATMLADQIINGQSPQILAEIISNQFATQWVNEQNDLKTDHVPLAQQLERMRNVLEKSTFGNGIERVLYELNQNLHCLSPLLRSYFILTARQLLPALEKIAKSGNTASEPMDRHIAAFLIVRDTRSETIFTAMTPTEPKLRRGLAILSVFSELQYRYGPDEAPALAKWILPLVQKSTDRFLSIPLREKIKKKLNETIASGSLGRFHDLIDDPRHLSHDEQEFVMARRMHYDITREISEIKHYLKNRRAIAQQIGRPVAATVSSSLAIILIVFALLRAAIQSL